METVWLQKIYLSSSFGLLNVFPLGCKWNVFCWFVCLVGFCLPLHTGLIQHRKEFVGGSTMESLPISCPSAQNHDFWGCNARQRRTEVPRYLPSVFWEFKYSIMIWMRDLKNTIPACNIRTVYSPVKHESQLDGWTSHKSGLGWNLKLFHVRTNTQIWSFHSQQLFSRQQFRKCSIHWVQTEKNRLPHSTQPRSGSAWGTHPPRGQFDFLRRRTIQEWVIISDFFCISYDSRGLI